jgi:peptidoglycan/LPS O-acetylase OafA/YrhL
LQKNSSPGRLSGLDHLRALAIILVFVYHYRIFGHPPNLDEIGSFGWTGVDLFFILSGYLIGGQLFRRIAHHQPLSYGEFYFKRFFRIIPAYLAVVALYFTIPGFSERSELPPLWRFLTFTQNFGLDIFKKGAFSHAWSLCIEEQFYLLLPLFLLFGTGPKKKLIWLLPAFFLLGFILRIYSWYHFLQPLLDTPGQNGFGLAYYKYIYYPTYTRLDGLLAGLSLAALNHFRPGTWQKITSYGNALLIAGLLLSTGAWWICHDENQYSFNGAVFGFPAISLAYGVLVLAALSPTSVLYRHASGLTRWIATLSYSIYLTHKQLIHLTHQVLAPRGIGNDTYTSFWICMGISVIGGWVLHQTVEKPFLKLRERLLSRSRLPQLFKTEV